VTKADSRNKIIVNINNYIYKSKESLPPANAIPTKSNDAQYDKSSIAGIFF